MDQIVNIQKEFADLICKRYEGNLTYADIREVIDFLFGIGVIDGRKAKNEVMRDMYFKLIRQGETATEAKMILSVNYDTTFHSVKQVIYSSI